MNLSTLKNTSLLILSAVFLSACLQNDDSSSTELPTELRGDGEVIATINGKSVYKSEFDTYINARTGQNYDDLDFSTRERIFTEYQQLELLSALANERNLADSTDMKLKKRNLFKNLLAQELMQAEDEANPVTDAQLQAKYEKELPNLTPELFKARHILLETEDAAKAVIAELDKGADFIELAKEKSTGPSGPNGGDLGWFTAERMVAPFSAATAALEVGKYSATPVQTQFGFHVILKEDQRKEEAPTLESLKPRLTNQLKQERVREFIDVLVGAADIKVLFEDEKAEAAELIEELSESNTQ